MPIRIYSLAKELGIENKELVDACTKAGIKGKGSALASLNDDEVDKVKAFLTSAKAPPAAAKSAAPEPAMTRPSEKANERILDLDRKKKKLSEETKRSADPPPEVEAPAVEAVEPEPEVEESPATPTAPADKPRPLDRKIPAERSEPAASPAAEQPPQRKAPLDRAMNAPLRPERLSSPGRGGPMRDLGNRNRGKKEATGGGPRKDGGGKREGGTNIRLAAMPEVKQPPPSKKQDEQKVQKPDIALPQDTIRKVRQKGTAPLQQFTEAKQKAHRKKGKGAENAPAQDDSAGVGRGGRNRKSGVGATEKDNDGKGGMAGSRDARTRNRKRNQRRDDDDSPQPYYRRRQPRRRSGVNTAAPRKEAVSLELPCTVRSFSEAAGVPAGQVQKALLEMGTMANINAQIDDEVALMLAEDFSVEISFKEQQTLEAELIETIDAQVDAEEDLQARPPVVTFLGHVDHGKTSLLDAVIGINVVKGEAGGITQHIRAYTVNKDGQTISFVDTPGHEAFTEMRARGANVTDIAVLVVAADDGVMPQTEEAISHAKAAGVPIIVALNKIDLPGVDENKAMQDLATRGLLPSEWGGEIEVVKTSAISGEGLDTLLETILVTAELHEYKANPDRPAVGVCLEAEQEAGRGVMAKMIVKNGTLKVGDVVVCGTAFGRVKAMYDTLKPRETVEVAGPSVPVNVAGLDSPPAAGDKFYVLDDISAAREIAETRLSNSRNQELSPITKKVSLEDFQRRLESGNLAVNQDVVTLNLIIRADTQGSIEAIKKELEKLDHPEVQLRILQASVGGVSVADVTLASASEAVILAFNVVPDDASRSLADDRGVEIRRYEVIYKLKDDIKLTLEGKLKPEEQTVDLGTAMVLQTFSISRTGTIAGCRIMRGVIDRNCRVRVIRDSRIIGDYAIDTLKREKDDAKEVRQGMECGIKLAGFNDIKEADSFEAYRIEEVARTL